MSEPDLKLTAPEASAEAFDTALKIAAGDPSTRLQMILGEAYQKYQEVVRWVRDEIEKDEAKAPGLAAAAKARVHGIIPSGHVDAATLSALLAQREMLDRALVLAPEPNSCDDAPKQLTEERER